VPNSPFGGVKLTETNLSERLQAYLSNHHVVTLATADPDGPWAAPVFYASAGFTIFFVSNPTSRHGQGIGDGSSVAAVITEDHRDWEAINGVQIQGRCRPATLDEREQALDVFLVKFPFARNFLDPAGPMYQRAGSKVIFYRLDPDSLWFTDNARGFGHRERLDLRQR